MHKAPMRWMQRVSTHRHVKRSTRTVAVHGCAVTAVAARGTAWAHMHRYARTPINPPSPARLACNACGSARSALFNTTRRRLCWMRCSRCLLADDKGTYGHQELCVRWAACQQQHVDTPHTATACMQPHPSISDVQNEIHKLDAALQIPQRLCHVVRKPGCVGRHRGLRAPATGKEFSKWFGREAYLVPGCCHY